MSEPKFGHQPGPFEDQILQLFGITRDALLGQGSEARVFALPDGDRVLRVMGPHADTAGFEAYNDRLGALLAGFEATPLDVAVPRWLDAGAVGTQHWRVEERIEGADLTTVLASTPDPAHRRALLTDFVRVAWAMGSLAVPVRAWAPATEPDETYDSVAALLDVRLEPGLDVAGLEAVGVDARAERARLVTELSVVDCEPGLVHADFFPNNVFAVPATADDAGRITGVGDFSLHDLIADPFMTVVGAVVMLTIVDYPGVAEDAAWLESEVLATLSEDLRHRFDLYRRWYGLYYSMDPRIHAWCRTQFPG